MVNSCCARCIGYRTIRSCHDHCQSYLSLAACFACKLKYVPQSADAANKPACSWPRERPTAPCTGTLQWSKVNSFSAQSISTASWQGHRRTHAQTRRPLRRHAVVVALMRDRDGCGTPPCMHLCAHTRKWQLQQRLHVPANFFKLQRQVMVLQQLRGRGVGGSGAHRSPLRQLQRCGGSAVTAAETAVTGVAPWSRGATDPSRGVAAQQLQFPGTSGAAAVVHEASAILIRNILINVHNMAHCTPRCDRCKAPPYQLQRPIAKGCGGATRGNKLLALRQLWQQSPGVAASLPRLPQREDFVASCGKRLCTMWQDPSHCV